MNWKPNPLRAGEYIIAFKNTANLMEGFRHIEIKEDNQWVEPGTDQMVFLGSHINIIGYAKLTMPKIKP